MPTKLLPVLLLAATAGGAKVQSHYVTHAADSGSSAFSIAGLGLGDGGGPSAGQGTEVVGSPTRLRQENGNLRGTLVPAHAGKVASADREAPHGADEASQAALYVALVMFALVGQCFVIYLVRECLYHRGAHRLLAGAGGAGGGSLMQAVADPLVGGGAQEGDVAEGAAGGSDGAAGANRARFEENQRVAAAQMLHRTIPVFMCLIVLLLALACAGIVIYIAGWVVWLRHRGVECDQPLQWWLIVVLVIPLCPKGQRLAAFVKLAVVPASIGVGIVLSFRCVTCQATNPALYHFTHTYLVFQVSEWAMVLFVNFGIVSLMQLLSDNGLMELLEAAGKGRQHGRPGLIHDVQTVSYSPILFGDGDQQQPGECCICQEAFDANLPIKCTPCAHYFHEECLGSWLGKFAGSCPLCRADIEHGLVAKP